MLCAGNCHLVCIVRLNKSFASHSNCSSIATNLLRPLDLGLLYSLLALSSLRVVGILFDLSLIVNSLILGAGSICLRVQEISLVGSKHWLRIRRLRNASVLVGSIEFSREGLTWASVNLKCFQW